MNRHTVICIGSNIEAKTAIVADIIAELSTMLGNFSSSGIYVNDDDSGLGAPYANAVCCGDYKGDMESLVRYAALRETRYGRTPQSKASGIMPLDIDIVVFSGHTVNPIQFDKTYFRQGYDRLAGHISLCPSMPK